MNCCLFSPVYSLAFKCLQIVCLYQSFLRNQMDPYFFSFLPISEKAIYFFFSRISPRFSRTVAAISEIASCGCLSKNLTSPYFGFVRIQSWNPLISANLKVSSSLKYSYAILYRYCLGHMLAWTFLENANPKIFNLCIFSALSIIGSSFLSCSRVAIPFSFL